MIVGIKHAILHILDANSGVTVYSDAELDVSDAGVNNFLTKHIDKLYEGAGLRRGEFNSGSGFLYHVKEYLEQPEDGRSLKSLSLFAAERLYEGIASAEETESCDVIVCDCTVNETPVIAVLKCDSKTGYTHQVLRGDDGGIANNLINHYSILPPVTQKLSECAFVDLNDFSVKYSGRRRKIDGETVDLIADILLDGVFDLSPRESVNTVAKLAKKIAEENGADPIETSALVKKCTAENMESNDFEFIDTEKVAENVFDGRPAMKEELVEKLRESSVPEKVEVTSYVTKKINSNIKITTDIGVELSFPAEYYRDSDYIEIINNENGTISIRINNINELKNR
ncbi:MAG TPA: nucleoid-associated protein [Candidatus Ornithomonoglobus intestinigallinarum]|uniref:Nucleoid-associated protein n=1 Tax=Candidatus Ornithomonoglobus intestinigallinarum TaxID=2840894 RepID=A0A9D1KNZ7_9FIRM|nr:nucleoid-associated protein [Candidatus Ornithomonoglobus intestinigallinarum]